MMLPMGNPDPGQQRRTKMGNQRTSLCIAILFALHEKGCFRKEDILLNHLVSQRTYDRAISDLRCYLAEYRPWLSLSFDRKTGWFTLINNK